MRGTLSIAVPMDVEPRQLKALASLLSAVERGRWDALESTAGKMRRERAQLDDRLADMLGQLAAQLRAEARDRDPEPAATGSRRA